MASQDGDPPRRRSLRALRLAEGVRALSRPDARRAGHGGCSARSAMRGLPSERRPTRSSCRSRFWTTGRASTPRSSVSSPGCERRRTTSASFFPSTARSSRPRRAWARRGTSGAADRAAPRCVYEGDAPRARGRVAAGELSLRGVNPTVLEVDERVLANVNTRLELDRSCCRRLGAANATT